METQQANLVFQLMKISTEQFAIITENYTDGLVTSLDMTVKHGADKEHKILVIFISARFVQNQRTFLMVEIACHFKISPESWETFVKENNEVEIPQAFAKHLAMISTGTLRGVLHAKTEGTNFNGFVLPTVNINKLITQNVKFI
jgi:hypothetical protein